MRPCGSAAPVSGDPVKEWLIIDGYNILYAWPEVFRLSNDNFEHARIKLIEMLGNYQALSGLQLIIVFDAYQVKGGTQHHEKIDGLEVIYTGEGETADKVIERLVAKFPAQDTVFVATSDYVQQRTVFFQGAYRISARELINQVREVNTEANRYISMAREIPNALDHRLSDQMRKKLEKWRRGKI